MTRPSFLPIVALSLLTTGTSHAAALAVYDFTAGSATVTSTIGASATDMTAGAFNDRFGTVNNVGISGSSETIFVRATSTGSSTASGDGLDDAIADESYFSFSITAGANDLTLTTLDFNYWITSGAALAYTTYVMSDLAGAYTVGNELGSGTIDPGSGVPDAGSQVPFSIDISSLGTLAAGNTAEFRLYFADASSGQQRIHRIDDVTVNGSVVPEPSTGLLAALAGLGLLARRRS